MQFLPILFCLSIGSYLVAASPPRLSGLETVQQEPPVQSETFDENPESELQKSELEEPEPENDGGDEDGPIVEENDPDVQNQKSEESGGTSAEEKSEPELSEDSDDGAGPAEPELSEHSDNEAGPAESELSEDSDEGAGPAEPELSDDSDNGAEPAGEEDEQVAEPPVDVDGGNDDEPILEDEDDEDEQQDEVQVQQPRQTLASCCPDEFKQFRDNCYIGVNSPPKAFKAVPVECAKLGADFASIHSRAEYEWVKRHYDLNKFWIGVVAYADGHRENEDGTDTDFQAFDDPVWDEHEKHPYICKMAASCGEEM